MNKLKIKNIPIEKEREIMQKILFSASISQYNLMRLISSAEKLPLPRIIFINSSGGVLQPFYFLEPVIRKLRYSSVAFFVGSAAITLYVLGERRLAIPESRFYFHEVSCIINDAMIPINKFDELIRYAMKKRSYGYVIKRLFGIKDNMIKMQEFLVNLISRETGISEAQIYSWMLDETTLSALKAYEMGLVEKIVTYEEALNNPDI